MKAEELKDKEDLKDGVAPTSIEGGPNEGTEGGEDLESGDGDKDDDDKDDKPTFGNGSNTFPIEK